MAKSKAEEITSIEEEICQLENKKKRPPHTGRIDRPERRHALLPGPVERYRAAVLSSDRRLRRGG